MSIGEVLARRRVTGGSGARDVALRASGEVAADQAALLRLALFAMLSVAAYYLALVRPYSLQQFWMSHHLDLDRLGPTDPAARWSILGGLLAAALLYYMAYRTVSQMRGNRTAAWIIMILGGLASSIVLLYFYPLGSTDIWDYIIHGRMLALHNANPFVQVAAQYPGDVFAWYAGWPFDTSAYGPFWEVLAGVTARLAGNQVIHNVVAFKLLELVFLVASVGTVAAILHRVAPERALAGALLLFWNPLVLYETIANGHNDIVMIFWMLVAVSMMVDRRYTVAILALVAGGLVKFIPVLMIPAAGLIALRDLPNHRARAVFLLTTAVASAALIVMAYAPFWAGPRVLAMARRQEMYINSLPAALVMYLVPRMGFKAAALEVSKFAGLLTMAYAILEGFRALRDRSWESFVRSSFNILMFYLLVTCLWFWDWYAMWPLALAVLLPSGHAKRLAHVFVIAALSRPLVFSPLFTWHQPADHGMLWQQLRMGPSIMALPLFYLIYAFWDKILGRLQARFAEREPRPAYVSVGRGDGYIHRQDRLDR